MGTVVSVESTTVSGVREVFAEWEARFSLFMPSSELSRVASGELALVDSSDDLRAVYGAALDWRERTNGAFSPHRPDGVIDLNGIVKAAATQAAGDVLNAAGCRDWSLNVGGDILVSGAQPDGTPWSIGISDPRDRAALLAAVRLTGSRRAVATSGSAERGDHIWLGGSTAPAQFIQVTVVADDIITADVLATAIVAGGRESLDDLTNRFDIDVLAIDRAHELLATPGLRAALAAQAGAE